MTRTRKTPRDYSEVYEIEHHNVTLISGTTTYGLIANNWATLYIDDLSVAIIAGASEPSDDTADASDEITGRFIILDSGEAASDATLESETVDLGGSGNIVPNTPTSVQFASPSGEAIELLPGQILAFQLSAAEAGTIAMTQLAIEIVYTQRKN